MSTGMWRGQAERDESEISGQVSRPHMFGWRCGARARMPDIAAFIGAVILHAHAGVLQAAQVTPFPTGSPAGPHPVGFTMHVTYDAARPIREVAARSVESWARPIRLAIWYPSQQGALGARMTLRQLMRAVCASDIETLPDTRAAMRCWADLEVTIRDVAGSDRIDIELEKLLSRPLLAVAGAAPVDRMSPVLLIDTGLVSYAGDYFSLAEHAASHGFVVVCLPSRPERPNEKPRFDSRGIDNKLLDSMAAINALRELKFADPQRIVVAAWSVGGVSAALLQMRNSNIRAFISLDSATGYEYGWELLQKAPAFELDRASVPYLHLVGSVENSVPKSAHYYTSIRGPEVFLGRVEGFAHGSFFAAGGVLPNAITSTAEARAFWRSHAAMQQLIVQFLQETLQQNAGSPLREVTAETSARIELTRRTPRE